MIKSLLILALLFSLNAEAVTKRTYQAKKSFRVHNPCPVTNKTTGACRGYVVDHLVPLCADGLDHPDNMQWSKKKESYKKDTEERFICRKIRGKQIRPFTNIDSFCKQIRPYKLPITKEAVCQQLKIEQS